MYLLKLNYGLSGWMQDKGKPTHCYKLLFLSSVMAYRDDVSFRFMHELDGDPDALGRRHDCLAPGAAARC